LRWVRGCGSRKTHGNCFSRHGIFNPLIEHRQQRVLRQHQSLLDFCPRAASGHSLWLPVPIRGRFTMRRHCKTGTDAMTTWLLLRGLTRGAGHWGSFVGRFKEAMPHSQVIALDLPGNGVLHQQRSATTVSEMVAQCRCQLSVRAIAPPYHVLAMSLGAMVAVEWASSYPQDIAASVLINTSLRPYNPFYQRLRPDNYMTLLKLMLGRPGPLAWEQAILRMTSNQNPSNALSEWVALRERFNVSRRNALAQLAAAARYSAPAHPPQLFNAAAGERQRPPGFGRVLRGNCTALAMHAAPPWQCRA
jgi:pimeloyl-ACP methyl ester carboxylesterase